MLYTFGKEEFMSKMQQIVREFLPCFDSSFFDISVELLSDELCDELFLFLIEL